MKNLFLTHFFPLSHYLRVLQWILILILGYETHIFWCLYSSSGHSGIDFLVTELFKGTFFLLLFGAVSTQWVHFGITCNLYLLTPEKRICVAVRDRSWGQSGGTCLAQLSLHPLFTFFSFSQSSIKRWVWAYSYLLNRCTNWITKRRLDVLIWRTLIFLGKMRIKRYFFSPPSFLMTTLRNRIWAWRNISLTQFGIF